MHVNALVASDYCIIPVQAHFLASEGIPDVLDMVRIIVRPMAAGGYEILAGHNRANAAKLAGWQVIPAEIVEADDARAIVTATSTNLIQRQELVMSQYS